MIVDIEITRATKPHNIFEGCSRSKRQFKINVANEDEAVYFISSLVKNSDKYFIKDYEDKKDLSDIKIQTSFAYNEEVNNFIDKIKKDLQYLEHIPQITVFAFTGYNKSIIF